MVEEQDGETTFSPTNSSKEHLNAGQDEAQAGVKIAGRNINNLRYTDDTTLMTESKELKRE